MSRWKGTPTSASRQLPPPVPPPVIVQPQTSAPPPAVAAPVASQPVARQHRPRRSGFLSYFIASILVGSAAVGATAVWNVGPQSEVPDKPTATNSAAIINPVDAQAPSTIATHQVRYVAADSPTHEDATVAFDEPPVSEPSPGESLTNPDPEPAAQSIAEPVPEVSESEAEVQSSDVVPKPQDVEPLASRPTTSEVKVSTAGNPTAVEKTQPLPPDVEFSLKLPSQEQAGAAETCSAGKKHGTTIEFAESPKAAAEQAEKQGKLVFMVLVSGNFAREEFT